MSKGRYRFVTSCIGSTYEDIQSLKEHEHSVELATFRRAIGVAQWRELTTSLGYDRDFPISRDWAVRFGRSIYRGVPAYFLRHSGIEYIFTLDGKMGPSLAR